MDKEHLLHNNHAVHEITGDMKRREFVGAAITLFAAATSCTTTASFGSGKRTALKLKGLDNETVTVDSAALRHLQRGLKGELLLANAPEYELSRHIWNADIQRRPALIVRCADAHDVAHAVKFAARNNALTSVRGGGHNAAGFAICDGGLVIDLSRMNQTSVNSARKTATVQGGATFADFDGTTQRAGLASTGAIISMVGVGGFTLGGGAGWLHRKIGLACDNLVSAQVVTADGRIVDTSASRHPDLFWAIRGGGGNFGVVSAFEFNLTPLPSVLAGLIYHPLESLPEVAAFVRDFNATAPDDVCVWLMMRKAPASATLPVSMHGRPVATIAVCYAGNAEHGEKVLRPLRQFGQPLLDLVKLREYTDWQKALDAAWGNGFGNHWVGHYLPELTDASASTMLEHVSQVTSRYTDVKLVQLGGAMARVHENETAFGHRNSKYALVIQTRWESGDNPARHLAWSRAFFDAMQEHSTGKVYVNFMADEGQKRVADAYNPETFKRLRAIKTLYDPHNRFRLNQNIRPA